MMWIVQSVPMPVVVLTEAQVGTIKSRVPSLSDKQSAESNRNEGDDDEPISAKLIAPDPDGNFPS